MEQFQTWLLTYPAYVLMLTLPAIVMFVFGFIACVFDAFWVMVINWILVGTSFVATSLMSWFIPGYSVGEHIGMNVFVLIIGAIFTVGAVPIAELFAAPFDKNGQFGVYE